MRDKSWFIEGDVAYVSSLGGLMDPKWVKVMLLPLCALLAVMVAPLFTGAEFKLRPLYAQYLPMVVAFAVWGQLMERAYGRRFKMRYVPLLGGACAGLMMSAEVLGQPYREALLFAATCCGLFATIRPKDVLNAAWVAPIPTFIALFAGATSKLFYTFSQFFWQLMCQKSAAIVEYLLALTPITIQVKAKLGQPIIVWSEYFKLRIHKPCSGLEGIFLFYFLLCMVLLIDWKIFSKQRWWIYLLIGGGYIFFFNGLRIASFFLVGHYAWLPGGSEFQHSLRGTPLEMFHDFIGWTYYLIAFSLFTTMMYRIAERSLEE